MQIRDTAEWDRWLPISYLCRRPNPEVQSAVRTVRAALLMSLLPEAPAAPASPPQTPSASA